jgi:SAM-dependent methyltransferase
MDSIDYSGIADLYDSLVRFEDDIPFFLEAAKRSPGPVLELMSGTGRVSIPLLQAGIPLTCVDYSPEMLAVLRNKIDTLNLTGQAVLADIRKLSFVDRFTLAFLPFNSFSELITEPDQAEALDAVHRSLKDDGRFICTLHNPLVRLRTIDGELRTMNRFPHPSGRGEVVFRIRLDYDAAARLASGVQYFDEYDEEGILSDRRTMELRFALPGRHEFEKLAASAGFKTLSLHGDYLGAEYRQRESPFMIWVLQR